jgi:small-conductance mechanosensitive channel
MQPFFRKALKATAYMIRKTIFLLTLVVLAVLLWFLDTRHPSVYVHKSYLTAATLAGIYCIFKIVIEEFLARGIQESKTKYSLRKTFSIIYLVVFLVIILRIWVENAQTLLVSYGLIAAGVAVALQDFFKNFAGGIILFVAGIYRIGDRIEVNGQYGDVIDIGILYTTLMELGQWMGGDHETGRLTIIPNGYVLSGHVANYNKDNNFIWDELMVPITYESDWRAAVQLILAILKRETAETARQADKEIAILGDKYYLFKRSTEPSVYVAMTDNWISLKLRYIANFRKRSATKNKLTQLLLTEIEKADTINIASATYDIVGFPELTLKEKES